jgi:hypothetical protein
MAQTEIKGIAKTDNVSNLFKMYQALDGRSRNVPGIGLLAGEAGIGKTTAITWLQNRTKSIVLECSPVWTPYGMLSDLCRELGEGSGGGASAALNRIVERLRIQGRGLVLDECDDRLFMPGRKYFEMVDLLRAIHDRTGVPLIFVGYQRMRQTVARFPQLEGRVSQEVDFHRLTISDTRLFAEALHPHLKLADCLIKRLFKSTEGRPRQTVTALELINSVSAGERWAEVTAEVWGDRKFFPGDRQ